MPCQIDGPQAIKGRDSELLVKGAIYDCHGGDYHAADRSADGCEHGFDQGQPKASFKTGRFLAHRPVWASGGGATSGPTACYV